MDNHLPTNTFLGKLRILEILDWHDRPHVLITENASGNRYVAFWADATENEGCWLYASVSEPRIDCLVAGRLALRSIYTEPEDGFIFWVRSPHQAPSSVEVTTADALEPGLLPSPNDCLTTQAGFFAADDFVATQNTDPLIHEITIHRPRSSKAIAFESLASVAASWSQLVHAALNSPPVLLRTSTHPLVFELQTEAGLPQLLQHLQTLIVSPTPEQLNTSYSHQEWKLLERFLEALHSDKLTCSIKLQSDGEPLNLVLSYASTKALRTALIGLNQQSVGATDVPQADDLDKLFSMLELMKAGDSNLGYHLELSPRHINYYKQAARVLDLLDERDSITSRGYYLVSLPHVVERYEIAMMLFESSPVGFAWLRYSAVQTAVDLDPESSTAFLNAQSTNLSAATISRRAQTLRYWVQSFREQLT